MAFYIVSPVGKVVIITKYFRGQKDHVLSYVYTLTDIFRCLLKCTHKTGTAKRRNSFSQGKRETTRTPTLPLFEK